MSNKKRLNSSKVLSTSHPLDKDVTLPVSSSPELTKFRHLLAQYKAKVFEQNASLFES